MSENLLSRLRNAVDQETNKKKAVDIGLLHAPAERTSVMPS